MSTTTVTTTISGQNAKIYIPDNYNGVAIPYHHGLGEDETSLMGDSLKSAIVARMLSDGYLLASSNGAGDNWGNQASIDAYVALQGYLVTHYAPTKTVIFGQSMGGHSSLMTAASRRIAGLCGWFGIYPGTNLANMYSVFPASIRSAFGIAANGSDYSSKTAGYDPNLLTAQAFPAISMRFYASPSDATVSKASNSDMLAATLASRAIESAVVLCSGGHGDPSHFQPDDLSAFLARAIVAPVGNARRVPRLR